MANKRFTAAISICIFSLTASAQYTRGGMRPRTVTTTTPATAPLYSIEQLNGKWQETSRVNAHNENQTFSDTLLLTVKNNKGGIKDASGMAMEMKGAAEIEAPAILNVAGTEFIIKKLNNDMLLLQDDQFVRTLMKRDRFYYETLGKDSVAANTYTVPVNTDMDNLKGKWEVYRRQAPPGFITPTTALIKSFTVSAGNGASGSGEITVYNGDNIAETFPCVISLSAGQIKISSQKGTMLLNVYKASGSEFIFGDDKGVMNYAKK